MGEKRRKIGWGEREREEEEKWLLVQKSNSLSYRFVFFSGLGDLNMARLKFIQDSQICITKERKKERKERKK